MKQFIKFTLVICSIGIITCNPKKEKQTETGTLESTQKTEIPMQNFIALFEIPANDVDRAIAFYQAVLDIPIEKMEMPGMEMGVFPYENQAVHGVIMKAEGMVPSANGVTVYLNGRDDLQPMLDRIEANGGEIIVPKTPHADESGFFALFLDSEGNQLGLNSPN
ncbi:MAG: VOC family protein [Bacteroidota bacterium]